MEHHFFHIIIIDAFIPRYGVRNLVHNGYKTYTTDITWGGWHDLYCLDALRNKGSFLFPILTDDTSLLRNLFATNTATFDLTISIWTNSYSDLNEAHWSFQIIVVISPHTTFRRTSQHFINIDKKCTLLVTIIYINFHHYYLINYNKKKKDQKLQLVWSVTQRHFMSL